MFVCILIDQWIINIYQPLKKALQYATIYNILHYNTIAGILHGKNVKKKYFIRCSLSRQTKSCLWQRMWKTSGITSSRLRTGSWPSKNIQKLSGEHLSSLPLSPIIALHLHRDIKETAFHTWFQFVKNI